jgi:hypothetical protein
MATDIFGALPGLLFDASSLTTSYQVVPYSAMAYPACLVRVVNDSTKAVWVSFDGVTDNTYLRSGSDAEIYAQVNKQPSNNKSAFPAQTKMYLRLPTGDTAGTGSVIVETYYNKP